MRECGNLEDAARGKQLTDKGKMTDLEQEFHNSVVGADLLKVKALILEDPKLPTCEFRKELGTNPPILLAVRVPGFDGHGEDIPVDLRSDVVRSKIVRIMIENGADPKYKYKRRVTPLHMAARFGLAKCIRVLIEAGADVNAVNSEKETPLFRAANLGHEEAVIELIRAGADIGRTNKKGDAALDRSKKKGFRSIVSIIECAQRGGATDGLDASAL